MKHTKTIALLSGALILGLGGGALVGDHIMSDPHRAAAVVNTLNDAPNTAQLSPAYFVPFNNFHDGEHAKSRAITDTMADGGITDFIKPLLIGWNSAALGALETDNLNTGRCYRASRSKRPSR